MTRKKVKLSFIQNDSSRKATYKKRKKGLLKKVSEISTLCGINACAIIYSPYDSTPQVWPSNSGVERVISQFKTLPEMDQNKKMVDQGTFLKQRIAKAIDNWKRQRKDNREMEMTEVMFQCLDGNMGMFHFNVVDLNDFSYTIEQYLKNLDHRLEILQSSGMEIGQSSNAVAAPPSEGIGSLDVVAVTTSLDAATIHEVGSSSSSLVPARFFNSIPPHGGFYEQPPNQNQNQNQNQHQWFLEMMNHPEQMRYVAEQLGFPFMNDNHDNRNHHNHPPPQQ